MAIFYDDGNTRGFPINTSRMNPNSQWANHSYNHFVLKHIYLTSTDPREKMQASKEIGIAERKMKFWERQHGFLQSTAFNWRRQIYKY